MIHLDHSWSLHLCSNWNAQILLFNFQWFLYICIFFTSWHFNSNWEIHSRASHSEKTLWLDVASHMTTGLSQSGSVILEYISYSVLTFYNIDSAAKVTCADSFKFANFSWDQESVKNCQHSIRREFVLGQFFKNHLNNLGMIFVDR